MKPIMHGNNQDYLINVPCSCIELDDNITGYFYDTSYRVELGDTFDEVSDEKYSGQAWKSWGDPTLITGTDLPIHLPCGCVESDSQTVVTYTVQDKDTLSYIATLLSAQLSEILKLNENMTQSSTFIDEGWVLFVPMENNSIPYPPPKKGEFLLKLYDFAVFLKVNCIW
jgi:LysM repeat protein